MKYNLSLWELFVLNFCVTIFVIKLMINSMQILYLIIWFYILWKRKKMKSDVRFLFNNILNIISNYNWENNNLFNFLFSVFLFYSCLGTYFNSFIYTNFFYSFLLNMLMIQKGKWMHCRLKENLLFSYYETRILHILW